MITFPNAKINIGLRVTGKRTDGFHNIETIFYPVPLCDALEFNGAEELIDDSYLFTSSGIELTDCPVDQNLCVKAYMLITRDFNLPKLKIHLHKKIPSGAGLGGGSSDATHMIKALKKYFNLNISDENIKKYASELGSDCAFFIKNKPAYATEKGDVLSPAVFSLWGYHIVIIHPDIHVNTADAYLNVEISAPEAPLTELIKKPVIEWKDCIVNDFEQSVSLRHPEIKIIKEKLYNIGAEYASMSGSGSAVFGLFDEVPVIDNIFPDTYFIWKGKL